MQIGIAHIDRSTVNRTPGNRGENAKEEPDSHASGGKQQGCKKNPRHRDEDDGKRAGPCDRQR